MAVGKKTDQFANIAAVEVTEAVAGTIAYAKFAFPFSIMDKMALLISRIEYWFGSLPSLNSGGDYVAAGIIAGNSILDPFNQADPLLIDSARILRLDYGTAASGEVVDQPRVKDFSRLPGGGILVAPNPLSAFVRAVNAGAAMSCWVKVFYTYMELGTEEYWQLVESRRVITT